LLNYKENEASAVFTGLEFEKVNKCIGDPEADKENPVLKAEQDAQVR
jgi:hypothetical protein